MNGKKAQFLPSLYMKDKNLKTPTQKMQKISTCMGKKAQFLSYLYMKDKFLTLTPKKETQTKHSPNHIPKED